MSNKHKVGNYVIAFKDEQFEVVKIVRVESLNSNDLYTVVYHVQNLESEHYQVYPYSLITTYDEGFKIIEEVVNLHKYLFTDNRTYKNFAMNIMVDTIKNADKELNCNLTDLFFTKLRDTMCELLKANLEYLSIVKDLH